jgi:hypothetical protein
MSNKLRVEDAETGDLFLGVSNVEVRMPVGEYVTVVVTFVDAEIVAP